MTSDELEELILSTASSQWQKVAIVIARVSHDERFASGDPEDELTVIADRIGHMVASGHLVAQGDISIGGTAKFASPLKSLAPDAEQILGPEPREATFASGDPAKLFGSAVARSTQPLGGVT